MSQEPLDPLIHAPARLRIVVTLAALGEGDSVSFMRLGEMLELTPGNLITHLRKLQEAGYVVAQRREEGEGQPSTRLALSHSGRAALEVYTRALRELVAGV